MDYPAARRQWANRSGEFSPRYYAYYGPNEVSEAVRGVLDAAVSRDASVLELGCSSGRHLAHLHDYGYTDLVGIEVNDEAVEVMRETYPDTADASTVHVDPIEEVLPECEDDRFDVAFSAEVLQHLDPDADWVFDELARVVGQRLVTVEVEGDLDHGPGEYDVTDVDDDLPLVHRNWRHVFESRGFEQVESRTLGNDTFRVFRPVRD